jgi:hypothetical protein
MRPSSPRQPGPRRQPRTVNQAHDPLPKRHEGRRAKPAETAAPLPPPAPLPETAAKRRRTGKSARPNARPSSARDPHRVGVRRGSGTDPIPPGRWRQSRSVITVMERHRPPAASRRRPCTLTARISPDPGSRRPARESPPREEPDAGHRPRPGRPCPGKARGPPACQSGCTPGSAVHLHPETPPARPSVAVRGKPTVHTDRRNCAHRPS